MTEDKYFATNQEDEAELQRLSMITQIYDPITKTHIEALGIKDGWRCLDVGAGGGSIADWLSEKVGVNGKVVATDIKTKFLEYYRNPKFEIRKHNIVNDDIEENQYDLVHCRFLLMHLTQYQQALENMLKATRPGGWLIIEELDPSSARVINRDNPKAELVNNFVLDSRVKMSQAGIMDFNFGCQVRILIDNLKLSEAGHDGIAHVYRGGEIMAKWDLMNTEVSLQSNVFNEKDYAAAETLKSILIDPDYYFTAATVFSAWGRKLK